MRVETRPASCATHCPETTWSFIALSGRRCDIPKLTVERSPGRWTVLGVCLARKRLKLRIARACQLAVVLSRSAALNASSANRVYDARVTKPGTQRAQFQALLAAIVRDDSTRARALLHANPALATLRCTTARLYRRGVLHWLYVGDTALHLAAAAHRAAIVRMLLSAGADPNACANHRHGRPLHYAADGVIDGPDWNAARQVRTIAHLLAAGAAIDAPDKNGATALHRAVRTRCAAAVRALLASGANPDSRNANGSTPLRLAQVNSGRGGSGHPRAKRAQRVIDELLRVGGAESNS
jgi:hypothetical protein